MRYSQLTSRQRLYLLILVGSVAAMIWATRWFDAGHASPEALTNTADIDVKPVSLRRNQREFDVRCRVTNQAQQTADQVVLTASIVDGRGRNIAVNPLVAIADLPPATSRLVEIMVPARENVPDGKYDAVVVPTVVRWRK